MCNGTCVFIPWFIFDFLTIVLWEIGHCLLVELPVADATTAAADKFLEQSEVFTSFDGMMIHSTFDVAWKVHIMSSKSHR